MELSGGVKQRRNQIESWSTLFMSASAAIVDVHVRGTGLEAREVIRRNVFPLASCPSPGFQAISQRIVMKNAG